VLFWESSVLWESHGTCKYCVWQIAVFINVTAGGIYGYCCVVNFNVWENSTRIFLVAKYKNVLYKMDEWMNEFVSLVFGIFASHCLGLVLDFWSVNLVCCVPPPPPPPPPLYGVCFIKTTTNLSLYTSLFFFFFYPKHIIFFFFF